MRATLDNVNISKAKVIEDKAKQREIIMIEKEALNHAKSKIKEQKDLQLIQKRIRQITL